MTRIVFDGQGAPIPELALPPFGSGSELPPTLLTFIDSGTFDAKTYRDLGFTHFETWCVGGAGGRGGGVQIGNAADPSYSQGTPLPVASYGGEGGGGGMHKVAGLMGDLPDSVPVVVGKRGLLGTDGNVHTRWLVASAVQDFGGVPTLLAVVRGATNIPYMVDASGNAIPPYFWYDPGPPWVPAPYLFYLNPYYVSPTNGGDGGSSSFNGALCQASGGKGGKKSPVYKNHRDDNDALGQAYLTGPGGDGGEGGRGGRAAAGGGGLGSTASAPVISTTPGPNYLQELPRVYTNAQDGGWVDGIGGGGGGGRGGTRYILPRRDGLADQADIVRNATPGGNGSFNYGDTSVYGKRGLAVFQIIPGTAGGARPVSNRKDGSFTTGYSPDGVVMVRLTRIT